MAIILRNVKRQTFVSETRRIDGKVVQKHLGNYNEPSLRLIYRTARLQVAIRKRVRTEIKQTKRDSKVIHDTLSVIDAVAERLTVERA